MKSQSPISARVGFVFVLGLFAGCSSGVVKVRGQVLKDGAPFQPGRGQMLRVYFYPLEGNAVAVDDIFPANQGDQRHTFVVPGKGGKGIPRGKYRVAISLSGGEDKDGLQGKFGRDNSPIIRDIQSSDELIIDLAKPAG